MLDVFYQIIPFFALVILGFGAGRTGFFPAEATAYLTRFVFYFALSALMLRFAATMPILDLLSWPFVLAYLCGTGLVFGAVMLAAKLRGRTLAEMAIEGFTSAVANSTFLGLPLLVTLMGDWVIGPLMTVVVIDYTVFAGLMVVLMSVAGGGRVSWAVVPAIFKGLLRNPMIMALVVGLVISALHIPLAEPVDHFLALLSAAATPGALFALGASLATRPAEKSDAAVWLTGAKLLLHPALVAFMALVVFKVPAGPAHVMIAVAAMPVASSTFILAQQYGVAVQRISTTILLTTFFSIITLPIVMGWVRG
ncbi:auxin efflux carrier family protein [Ketogulonicigenium robustum]|uniref:Auxin efflux carrier family protein n=1 Tax=Ketogulonicigenium robustum TaxID=92947 RepID=A0A1W6NX21_9RHOB|nr:AEC family transporter [Ketogulonicigenium robustum]ARO13660.1 auxin efflux carrier family protein [Ketogulonicigenium robustum]